MPSDTNLESTAPPIEQPATSGRPTNFEHSEIDMKPINHVTELLQFQGSAFVDTSYQALLGRKPDADGMTYYLDRLRTGRGKSKIIVQLAKSAESKAFKPKLQGLEDLLVDFERENHWFWGLWHRGRQVERQVNLLELQLGQLGEEMRQCVWNCLVGCSGWSPHFIKLRIMCQALRRQQYRRYRKARTLR